VIKQLISLWYLQILRTLRTHYVMIMLYTLCHILSFPCDVVLMCFEFQISPHIVIDLSTALFGVPVCDKAVRYYNCQYRTWICQGLCLQHPCYANESVGVLGLV
jgi:hypothetical protein